MGGHSGFLHQPSEHASFGLLTVTGGTVLAILPIDVVGPQPLNPVGR